MMRWTARVKSLRHRHFPPSVAALYQAAAPENDMVSRALRPCRPRHWPVVVKPMIREIPTVAKLLVLVRLGLIRGLVHTRRAPPSLLALRSVVLEPDHGRNIAPHVAPPVATLSWPSLDLVSSTGRCAHVAPRPRCSRCAPSCSNPTAAGTLHRTLPLWLPRSDLIRSNRGCARA